MLCAFGRQQSASSIIPQELVTLILLLACAWVWCAMTQEWRSVRGQLSVSYHRVGSQAWQEVPCFTCCCSTHFCLETESHCCRAHWVGWDGWSACPGLSSPGLRSLQHNSRLFCGVLGTELTFSRWRGQCFTDRVIWIPSPQSYKVWCVVFSSALTLEFVHPFSRF